MLVMCLAFRTESIFSHIYLFVKSFYNVMVLIPTKRISTKRYARALRRHQTDAERALWCLLFIGYLPQRAVHGFVPDFYSPIFCVTIEVQGSVHKLRDVKRRDKTKRQALRARGVYTIYVSNTYALKAPIIVMAEALITGIIWRLWIMVRL
jgi:very-short-patch-repair endonuclease